MGNRSLQGALNAHLSFSALSGIYGMRRDCDLVTKDIVISYDACES